MRVKDKISGVYLAIISVVSFAATGQEVQSPKLLLVLRVLAAIGICLSMTPLLSGERLTVWTARRIIRKDSERLRIRASSGRNTVVSYLKTRYEPGSLSEPIVRAILVELKCATGEEEKP
jgi:hypothetical protein